MTSQTGKLLMGLPVASKRPLETNVYTEIALDDIVRLRKPHPCGSTDWRVVRVGVDIGLVCLGCQHRVLLPRHKFNKQFKMKVSE